MSNQRYAILIRNIVTNKSFWMKDDTYPGTITFASVAEAKNHIKKDGNIPFPDEEYEIRLYEKGLI